MNVKKIIIIGCIIAIAILVSLRIYTSIQKTQVKPVTEAKLIPVKVATVEKHSIQDILTLTGTINPEKSVSIVSKIQGRVLTINAEEGSKVSEGQIVATIETADLDHSLQNAELAKVTADSNYQNAKLNLERYQKLFQEGLISQQQLDSANLAFTSADSNRKQAETNISQIKSQLESQGWSTGRDQNSGPLHSSRLISPLSGIVLKKFVEEGTLVSSASPLLQVGKIDRVKVLVSVEEQLLRYIKINQTVSITVDSWPDPFSGIITNILPQVDTVTRTITIEIAVQNYARRLLPGMFAKVKLIRQEASQVVALPVKAVMDDDQGKYIYVLKNDVAVKRHIQLGLANDELVQVTSGLNAGEKIIVAGQHSVEDGAKVEVVGGAE